MCIHTDTHIHITHVNLQHYQTHTLIVSNRWWCTHYVCGSMHYTYCAYAIYTCIIHQPTRSYSNIWHTIHIVYWYTMLYTHIAQCIYSIIGSFDMNTADIMLPYYKLIQMYVHAYMLWSVSCVQHTNNATNDMCVHGQCITIIWQIHICIHYMCITTYW